VEVQHVTNKEPVEAHVFTSANNFVSGLDQNTKDLMLLNLIIKYPSVVHQIISGISEPKDQLNQMFESIFK